MQLDAEERTIHLRPAAQVYFQMVIGDQPARGSDAFFDSWMDAVLVAALTVAASPGAVETALHIADCNPVRNLSNAVLFYVYQLSIVPHWALLRTSAMMTVASGAPFQNRTSRRHYLIIDGHHTMALIA
jgi:hypothetical protein